MQYPVIFGTDGAEAIHVNAGDHYIDGHGGEDTFAYALANLFGTDHIKDWQSGDMLQFDQLLAGGGSLDDLLNVHWDDGKNAFTGSTSGGVSISLSIGADQAATLIVADDSHSKTIVMEGYDFGSQVSGYDTAAEAAAHALLQDIIKVTG